MAMLAISLVAIGYAFTVRWVSSRLGIAADVAAIYWSVGGIFVRVLANVLALAYLLPIFLGYRRPTPWADIRADWWMIGKVVVIVTTANLLLTAIPVVGSLPGMQPAALAFSAAVTLRLFLLPVVEVDLHPTLVWVGGLSAAAGAASFAVMIGFGLVPGIFVADSPAQAIAERIAETLAPAASLAITFLPLFAYGGYMNYRRVG